MGYNYRVLPHKDLDVRKGNKVRHSFACFGGDALAVSTEKNQENDNVLFYTNTRMVVLFAELCPPYGRDFLC